MVGQNGPVWFLAATRGLPGASRVTRSCTLFADRAIFFPIINASYGAFTTDPPEQKTIDFLRAQVDCSYEAVQVKIDGKKVELPQSYQVQSPLFDVYYPRRTFSGLDRMSFRA